ncbi:MAG TPA: hypothetical protein VFQ37_11670 [Mycobacterium sp.]|nr:hypothetical protein [Mycobacterium sp.]
MPNPLVDELTPEVKAELAAIFAALRTEYPPIREQQVMVRHRSTARPWQLNRAGW